MPEPHDSSDERRNALREKLESRAGERKTGERKAADTRSARGGIAQAWRLSSEFLAGVLVGIALGWGFDWMFGTSPWGLIGFVLLGFCAAVLNVLRATGQAAPSRFKINPGNDGPSRDA